MSGYGVAVGAALEHEQRAAVDLVAHRLELAGVTVELEGEAALRLHQPQVVDTLSRAQPRCRLRGAQPLQKKDVLERVAAADVHVLVDLARSAECYPGAALACRR